MTCASYTDVPFSPENIQFLEMRLQDVTLGITITITTACLQLRATTLEIDANETQGLTVCSAGAPCPTIPPSIPGERS